MANSCLGIFAALCAIIGAFCLILDPAFKSQSLTCFDNTFENCRSDPNETDCIAKGIVACYNEGRNLGYRQIHREIIAADMSIAGIVVTLIGGVLAFFGAIF